MQTWWIHRVSIREDGRLTAVCCSCTWWISLIRLQRFGSKVVKCNKSDEARVRCTEGKITFITLKEVKPCAALHDCGMCCRGDPGWRGGTAAGKLRRQPGRRLRDLQRLWWVQKGKGHNSLFDLLGRSPTIETMRDRTSFIWCAVSRACVLSFAASPSALHCYEKSSEKKTVWSSICPQLVLSPLGGWCPYLNCPDVDTMHPCYRCLPQVCNAALLSSVAAQNACSFQQDKTLSLLYACMDCSGLQSRNLRQAVIFTLDLIARWWMVVWLSVPSNCLITSGD